MRMGILYDISESCILVDKVKQLLWDFFHFYTYPRCAYEQRHEENSKMRKTYSSIACIFSARETISTTCCCDCRCA